MSKGLYQSLVLQEKNVGSGKLNPDHAGLCLTSTPHFISWCWDSSFIVSHCWDTSYKKEKVLIIG